MLERSEVRHAAAMLPSGFKIVKIGAAAMLPHQTAGTPIPYITGIRIAQAVMRPDV